MQNEIGGFSFHGSLIKTVVEHWVSQSLFEPNDMHLRSKLSNILESYLPNIELKIEWNSNPIFIDNNAIAGDVFFIDENGFQRVANFYITASGANIKEDEQKN
ncbi:MAG: hypothetical protein AABY15_05875 [Nanoarchaeota archaeon]